MISGDTLRKLRMLKGSSQQIVANKPGISQPAYCKLEKRKYINERNIEKVLRVPGCTKEDVEKIKGFISPGQRSIE